MTYKHNWRRWQCPFCGLSYNGPYNLSVEWERRHRAACSARPDALKKHTPTPAPTEPDLFLPAGKKYIGCNLGSYCHIQKVYWSAKGYKGEICCVPKPCMFLIEAEENK